MNMSIRVELLMYPPLKHHDSFRLLKLKRSPSRDSWEGTLVEHRLSSSACGAGPPKYLALSYAWGETTYDVPSENSIEMGSSISIALMHILPLEAGESETLHIRIDRFCINQRDKVEKSRQVSMIWRIFAGAEKIIGWLGPAFEGCDDAFDDLILIAPPVLNDTASKDQFEQIVQRRFGDGGLAVLPCIQYIGSVMLLGSALRARMILLFSLQWFGRRWIAQEACLAFKLHIRCGQRSVSGEQIFQAIDNIQMIVTLGAASWLQKPFRNAFALLQTRQMVQEAAMDSSRLSLPYIVRHLSFLECECDVDRINALFGIVGLRAPWFSPEYGLPATDLYIKFAMGHMQFFQSTEILHFAGVTDPTKHQMRDTQGDKSFHISWPDGDLPSWVPDWRVRYRPLPIVSTKNETLDNASTSLPFVLRHDWLQPTLTLTGKILRNSIKPCGPPYLDSLSPTENRQYQFSVHPWCGQMFVNFLGKLDENLCTVYRRSPSFTQRFESITNAGIDPKIPNGVVLPFARTLIMNGMVKSTEKPNSVVPQDQILSYFHQYAKLNMAADSLAATEAYDATVDDNKSNEKAAAYGYLAEHVCRFRTLFLCDNGTLGLGNAGISPSDRICFFPGLSTPFILHQKEGQFLLGGECYLDGVMDFAYADLDIPEVEIVLE